MRDTVYRRYVRIPYIRVNESSLIQRNICNIPLVYSTGSAVSTYNVPWQNKAAVQLCVTPLIRGLATRQNLPSLLNGSMERRATEKAQSKVYQLLFMWRIEHEELQKQKIREQPGFVPPSRLGTNQSKRIATETKELTAARLARFSAVNISYGARD